MEPDPAYVLSSGVGEVVFWEHAHVQRAGCVRFSSLGSSPSYVELLTCLEIAKQAKELPGRWAPPGSARDQDFLPGGVLKELPDEPCICASL